MPHLFLMCLSLIEALLSFVFVGFAYARLKLPDPDEDPLYKLQTDIAEDLDMGPWAKMQRSKAVRRISFALACLVSLMLVAVACWQGILALG